jgi:hypothetical protein
MEWYSGALLDHGERMLTAATSVFNTRRSGVWLAGWVYASRGIRKLVLEQVYMKDL